MAKNRNAQDRIVVRRETFTRLQDFKAGFQGTYDEVVQYLLDFVGAEPGREFERGREIANSNKDANTKA